MLLLSLTYNYHNTKRNNGNNIYMKLGMLISEEVKLTLAKLAKEQLPLDTCLKLIQIIETIKQKEKELDELRLNLISKYGIKNADGSLQVDDNGNVILDDKSINDFAEEMNKIYNEELKMPTLDIKNPSHDVKYSCEELLSIYEILNIT